MSRRVGAILIALLLTAVEAFAQGAHQWTTHSISYDPGMDMCHGGRSSVQLLELSSDPGVQERVNTMLVHEMRALMGMEEAVWVDVPAVRVGYTFTGDSALFNWDVTFMRLFDGNDVASFEAVTISNCGNSISDMPEHSYYTIDLRTGAMLGRDDLMEPKRERELGQFVQSFARMHAVDNVDYLGDHDRSRLAYRDSLGTDFYITADSIGFSLWVFDGNEPDWARRGRDNAVVGEELMMVEVPKKELRRFVTKQYRRLIL